MIFEQVMIGGDRNFAYLIGDETTKQAAAVDPSYHPEQIIDLAAKYGLTIKYVLNTHSHIDHSNGNTAIKKAAGASLAGHPLSSPDIPLKDNDILVLGELKCRILHTPGHTPDSICILAGNKLITGDTLFVGKVGGTGFGEDARQEYHSLHDKLMQLPDNTEIYPGHDYGTAPNSTIGYERKSNPFILCESFEAFVDLKRNWLEYKRKHGIK